MTRRPPRSTRTAPPVPYPPPVRSPRQACSDKSSPIPKTVRLSCSYCLTRSVVLPRNMSIKCPAPKRWPRSRQSLYRSEEHTSELQSPMRISYAVFFFEDNNTHLQIQTITIQH